VVRASSKLIDLSDDQLLHLFSEGQSEAFGELFRRYRGLAYRVAYRLLNHEDDALDAVQDGFINALRNAINFRGQSSFKTWLLRVVANAALDLGRQRKRQENRFTNETVELDHSVEALHPSEGIFFEDLMTRLNAALEKLPQAQRETFVLHVDGELSYREVAEVLGVSIGTVMSRLFYARQRLKDFLVDQVHT
jgi:RNA polymerase sigma-70 factor, ECF subfamily